MKPAGQSEQDSPKVTFCACWCAAFSAFRKPWHRLTFTIVHSAIGRSRHVYYFIHLRYNYVSVTAEITKTRKKMAENVNQENTNKNENQKSYNNQH